MNLRILKKQHVLNRLVKKEEAKNIRDANHVSEFSLFHFVEYELWQLCTYSS